MKKMNELCDLPNVDGFTFTGICRDDRELYCKVVKTAQGCHRAYEVATGEWIFPELKGWRKLTVAVGE